MSEFDDCVRGPEKEPVKMPYKAVSNEMWIMCRIKDLSKSVDEHIQVGKTSEALSVIEELYGLVKGIERARYGR